MQLVCFWCALLASGNGHVERQLNNAATANKPYQVRLKLVEIDARGHRKVLESPRISMHAGAVVRVTQDNSAANMKRDIVVDRLHDGDVCEVSAAGRLSPRRTYSEFFWQIHLNGPGNSERRMVLHMGRITADRKSCDLLPTVRRAVQFAKIDRVILRSDNDGVPVAWVEIEMNDGNRRVISPFEPIVLSRATSESIGPVWFEPF